MVFHAKIPLCHMLVTALSILVAAAAAVVVVEVVVVIVVVAVVDCLFAVNCEVSLPSFSRK